MDWIVNRKMNMYIFSGRNESLTMFNRPTKSNEVNIVTIIFGCLFVSHLNLVFSFFFLFLFLLSPSSCYLLLTVQVMLSVNTIKNIFWIWVTSPTKCDEYKSLSLIYFVFGFFFFSPILSIDEPYRSSFTMCKDWRIWVDIGAHGYAYYYINVWWMESLRGC